VDHEKVHQSDILATPGTIESGRTRWHRPLKHQMRTYWSGKICFQSSFMMMTVQPLSLALVHPVLRHGPERRVGQPFAGAKLKQRFSPRVASITLGTGLVST